MNNYDKVFYTITIVALTAVIWAAISAAMPYVEGHIPGVYTLADQKLQGLSHILYHILEEEKKQTALLDHMDCISYHLESFKHPRKYCGEPLNYTGVWNER